jgi:cytochrome P450
VKTVYGVKDEYPKSPWYQVLVPVVKNVFNVSDIEFHRRHRRLLGSPISETSLRAAEPTVEDRAKLTMERIQNEMETRGASDVYKWFFFFATDVIGELSFGESFRMLEQGKVRGRVPILLALRDSY